MKRLTVLRHAKSSWDDPKLADFNRPLNERGWKAARRLGRELSKRGVSFDLVLASPAARVRETLDGVTEKLKLNAEIRFEPQIYEASEATLLQLVRKAPDAVRDLLIAGHNPGLQEMVFAITKRDSKGLRDRAGSKFPTGAYAVIELPVKSWSEIVSGSGEIVELIVPKDLD